jgi:hypothetical protein
MERKTAVKRKDSAVYPETMMNAEQACNEFKLNNTTRWHVLKKFKDVEHSVNDWTRIFREQRIV